MPLFEIAVPLEVFATPRPGLVEPPYAVRLCAEDPSSDFGAFSLQVSQDLASSGVLILLGGFAGAGRLPGSAPWLTRSGADWKRPTVQACPGDAGART